jgi:hypothetical protein
MNQAALFLSSNLLILVSMKKIISSGFLDKIKSEQLSYRKTSRHISDICFQS